MTDDVIDVLAGSGVSLPDGGLANGHSLGRKVCTARDYELAANAGDPGQYAGSALVASGFGQ